MNLLKEQVRRGRIAWMHIKARRKKEIDLPLGTTVIVAPHPDDEVLGCGGLMQRLITQGHEVHIVFMTGGEASHRNCCELPEEQIKKERRKLACQINPTLGVDIDHLHFLDFPDGGIKKESREAMHLKELMELLNPSTIFVPHWGEGWPDHIQTTSILKEIVNNDVNIYEYCVWMWYYNVWHLDWEKAQILRMKEPEHQQKMSAVDNYTMPKASCGRPWSGVLPRVLIESAKWKFELYFLSSKENRTIPQ